MPNLHENTVFSNHKTNNRGAVLYRPTVDQARTLLTYIEQRPDYDTWIRVVSAMGNTFDEQTALNLLLEKFSNEKPDEHLYKLRHRLPNTRFATLVWLAKQNGFKPDATFYADSPRPSGTLRQPVRKLETSFDDVRRQQELLVDTTTGERLFRLSINRYVVDKTDDFDLLNRGFGNVTLSLCQIADAVRSGSALCNAVLSGTRRCNVNFAGSEVVILDIDSSLTLEAAFRHPFTHHAALIYTTPSHTTEQNRFRILFPLPYFERNTKRYRDCVHVLQREYSADPAPSALVQTFYGSSQGKIWFVEEGGNYVRY